MRFVVLPPPPLGCFGVYMRVRALLLAAAGCGGCGELWRTVYFVLCCQLPWPYAPWPMMAVIGCYLLLYVIVIAFVVAVLGGVETPREQRAHPPPATTKRHQGPLVTSSRIACGGTPWASLHLRALHLRAAEDTATPHGTLTTHTTLHTTHPQPQASSPNLPPQSSAPFKSLL